MQELRGKGACWVETEENTVPGFSENLAQTEQNKLTGIESRSQNRVDLWNAEEKLIQTFIQFFSIVQRFCTEVTSCYFILPLRVRMSF